MSEIIEYRVNEEKRKVVANLIVDRDSVLDELANVLSKSFNSHGLPGETVFWGGMSNICTLYGKYTGIASCHPEDEFDVEKGKRIARLKAIKAYANDRKKITEKMLNIADDFKNRVNDMNEHSYFLQNNMSKEIIKESSKNILD